MAWSACYLECSPVLANDVLRNGKAETRTFGTAADHWEKYSFDQVFGYAGPIIDNAEMHYLFVANGPNGKLTHYPCFTRNASPFGSV
jgi:hypothetical protein